jgi:Zn-dependent M28 family amino/carboxypeptidase
LELASRISDYQAHFQHPVRLIAFSGEEQGLYGSAAYARECSRNQLEIRAMLQADMVGYNSRLVSDPKARKRVAFVKGNASKKLTAYIKQLVKRFVPRINIEDTNACCSDHQSFHEQGYESVGFVEAGGYLIDPQYHKPGDIVERAGYDLEQIQMIAKAVGASLADLAQID